MGTLNDFYCEKMYIQCIKEHFKAKKCPSDQCSELWLVTTAIFICIDIWLPPWLAI